MVSLLLAPLRVSSPPRPQMTSAPLVPLPEVTTMVQPCALPMVVLWAALEQRRS
jgi:hypothetical protein